MINYKIEWSEEDECYIAVCKEKGLEGLQTHGDTEEEALRALQTVVKLVQDQNV